MINQQGEEVLKFFYNRKPQEQEYHFLLQMYLNEEAVNGTFRFLCYILLFIAHLCIIGHWL